MEKKSIFTKRNLAISTTNQVATIEITSEQRKKIQILVKEFLFAHKPSITKKRRYMIADDETLSAEAQQKVRNSLLDT